MAAPQQQTKPTPVKPQDPKPANGTDVKPAEAVPPGTPIQAAEGGKEDEKATRGVIPHMPICVVWKDPTLPENKRVVAALIHPREDRVYKVVGRGVGGTTGTLEDEGYPIGPIRVDGPKWVEKKIPTGVEVLGYANVQGFPLPPQQS